MEQTNWKAFATARAAEVFHKGLGPCGVFVDPRLGVTIFYQNAPFPFRHRAVAEFERALESVGVTCFATVSYPWGGPADGQTVLCLIQGMRVEEVRSAWRP
jgi:hypothetical protein